MTVVSVKLPQDGSILDVEGLELVEGEVTVLFGPNGAGKTTLLRHLAGIGGKEPVLSGAYQPQTPYLFRGLAGWNLGLGLDSEPAAWAAQLADRFGVGGLLEAPASRLSGGEAQRLALARTLATPAEWILLDEPLGAVDIADKAELIEKIGIQLRSRSAVVVTHDLDVALGLGSRLVILDRGRILQTGPVAEVLHHPVSERVARIVGIRNLVTGNARTDGYGQAALSAGSVTIVGQGEADGPARAVFGADSVVLGAPGSPPTSARNRWNGSVIEVRRLGHVYEVVVDIGFPLAAMVTKGAVEELGLAPGVEVSASVKASAVVVIPG